MPTATSAVLAWMGARRASHWLVRAGAEQGPVREGRANHGPRA